MNKVILIIKREYLTRVKKRSFIVMTILGPILMAALMIVPVYLAEQSFSDTKSISVLDETGWFLDKFQNSENMTFHHTFSSLEKAKEDFFKSDDYALLYIPKPKETIPTSVVIYSEKQPNIDVKTYIKNTIKNEVESRKLVSSGIDENILKSIKTKIDISTIKISESGEEQKTYTEISMLIGIFSGILIYFFIFLFGSQVMRGVIEEKTSRIIEVIVSSVKPFQLMMGKIIGIAFVGLTQLLLWVILTFSIVSVFQVSFADKLPTNNSEILSSSNPMQQIDASKNINFDDNKINQVFEAIFSINFTEIILSFVFFFLFGYLIYAALFAAIGSAVDSEADTQQFMLPITIPLIFAIVMAQTIIQNPDGSLAFWLSIIPLTSPIIMMVRIPFGVPAFDLILSMVLLVLGFIGTTWMAGKIYRTGILMYGKKVNYKELWKWLRYKS